MTNKKWAFCTLGLCFLGLFLLGSITFIIDPFFHYHPPLEQLNYPLFDERHQIDGILRHFDYDTVIIGSSMTSNFKTTQCDALFGGTTVKTPLSATTYKEPRDHLLRAFEANPNIQTVIWGMDGFKLIVDKDAIAYDTNPTYLSDDSLWNDIQYVLNKQALVTGSFRVLKHTIQGNVHADFDRYDNFMRGKTFGKDAILQKYERYDKREDVLILAEEDKQKVQENLQQNIISLAQQYPDTQFLLFFPPVSIYYFELINRLGNLKPELDAYKFATELLLQQQNIKLYSFFDEYDMISNPDNYMDLYHYHEDINSKILVWMKEGQHQLTEENYEDHWNQVYSFLSTFDYDSLL